MSATAPARRKRKTTHPPTDGWWGDGPPPWERWPGVTLQLEARWTGARWESPCGRYWFDQAAADTAADFFPEFLRHHKGEFAGLPFTLLAYQARLIVRPLFGWKRVVDNLRRFRKVFLAVPKGSGKSPLGAGVGLFLTFCDGESGAEVYCVAADRDQAAIVFDTARIMVEGNPDLAEQANVMRRAIEVPSTHSYFRVLSSDVHSKHGPNIHGLIFDEFHAQPTRELYEVLHRGTVKRRQPVTLLITTAGDDDESICAEEWEYARNVMSGTYTDATYLPVIFEAAKTDDWRDVEVWKRVNPGYGVTVKAEALAAEGAAAMQEPRKLNDFLRYHLNRWVNQATAWIPIDWWDDCKGPLPDNLATLQPYAGLDLAKKLDLTAFVLTFVIPREGPALEVKVIGTDERSEPVERSVSLNYDIAIVPYFWIPEETMREHEKQDRVPYSRWAADGLIRVTEGNEIDFGVVYQTITGEITQKYPLLRQSQIAFDPAFATELSQKLQGAGYQTVEVLQNYQRLSEASLAFEAMVKCKRVRHGGHAVLRNHMENVSIKQDDAGRIRPVKPKRRAKRIDGVVGAIMGVSRIIVEPAQAAGWLLATIPRGG